MSPRFRTLLIGVAVVLSMALLAILGFRFVGKPALARLIDFSGQAERDQRGAEGHWSPAEPGDDFEDGEGARTSENSLAHFRLINGAKLRLKPASQVRFQRRDGAGAIGIEITVGAADLQSDRGAVRIESEFGPITLDAQSSVTLRRDQGRLLVTVEVGRIELGEQAREVTPGEVGTLELGGIIVEVRAREEPAPSPEAVPEPAPAPATAPEPVLEPGDGVAAVDLVADPGASFVVHDPNPPTAIGFPIRELCGGPAELRSGAQSTQASDRVALRFNAGRHRYQIRCLSDPERGIKSGDIRVLHDAGTQKLPRFTPNAQVTTDGRRYTVLYQHRLPTVTVSWPSAPQAPHYTLTVDGKDLKTQAPTHTFTSGALGRGSHSVAFAAPTEPPRRSRTTTIEVVYDSQAPAARVSEPQMEFEGGDAVRITGQALPGWKVAVGGTELELDAQNNFSTELETQNPLPLEFSHPNHGLHYYLRRPKAASP